MDAAAGQYASRVGYEINARGERVRSLQRLTADIDEATARHIRLQQDWNDTKTNWIALRAQHFPDIGPDGWPDVAIKPVWITLEWKKYVAERVAHFDQQRIEILETLATDWVEDLDSSRKQITRTRGELGELATDARGFLERLSPPVRDRVVAALRVDPIDLRPGAACGQSPTIEEAKEKFLDEFRDRIGKGSRYGRSPATFNTLKRELEASLKPLDMSRQVGHLTIADVRALCSYWTDLEARQVGGRTAENRVNAFRQFLRAMDGDESYGFRMPRGAMNAFTECKAHRSVDRITKIDLEQLRVVLRCLNDESRLHVLLALNCGMYPADISALTPDCLVDERGLPDTGSRDLYLKWRRSKTKRTNQFDSHHWLWPETAKLLRKQRASTNVYGRLLLNVNGKPLTCNEAGRGRTDTVGMNYRRRCRAAKVSPIPLMQLRKWGATAIARLAGLDVQMMYRAERPRGSSNDYVLLDFVGKLTPALRQWRRELAVARIFRWDNKQVGEKAC